MSMSLRIPRSRMGFATRECVEMSISVTIGSGFGANIVNRLFPVKALDVIQTIHRSIAFSSSPSPNSRSNPVLRAGIAQT